MAQILRALIVVSAIWFAGLAQAASPIVTATPPQPKWAMLTQQQQVVLAPLAGDWDNMENYRRKKWLGIAARYPSMTPDAQQRMQEKMREWAALPPEVRRDAREKYKEYNKLSPESKAALKQRWQEYQQQKSAAEGGAPANPPPPTAEEKR